MPRRTRGQATAYRNIQRIGSERAHEIARAIVERISVTAPYDEDADKPENLHLRNSYYVTTDPDTGDALIRCRRRYWVYVEYGTSTHERQPHVGPAIDFVKAQQT